MLAIRVLVMPNTYRDSVFLMKLSGHARDESGAVQVSAMMGTPRNKALFVQSGLSTPEVELAEPDDLVVAVQAESAEIDRALAAVKSLLDAAPSGKRAAGVGAVSVPQTIDQAVAADKNLNLALISVAGDYARYEAARALHAGLDVMLYSDNISTADELALKTLAAQKRRLVMGPDCGTAIINGVPLAFANQVRRGTVGLIAASGTGLQEVTCLLDRIGVGVSQAYGTGGRDLKDAIGGITTLAALDRLLEDPATQSIGILGKPPGAKTRERLLERIRGLKKAVAVHFLGAADYAAEDASGIAHAGDLTAFALLLAGEIANSAAVKRLLGSTPAIPRSKKGFLRGLFSGGTLCQEAAELARPILQWDIFSNLSVAGYAQLAASDPSRGHSFWDFGEDAFTVGRPHPMMAPEMRMERLVRELLEPDVSVVLLDVVIGYGAAAGQAELIVEALQKAERQSNGKSRNKVVVATVCGTEGDVPPRSLQARVLSEGGVVVLGSNAQAAVWAACTATEATGMGEVSTRGIR
jgi:FdrA protein